MLLFAIVPVDDESVGLVASRSNVIELVASLNTIDPFVSLSIVSPFANAISPPAPERVNPVVPDTSRLSATSTLVELDVSVHQRLCEQLHLQKL